MESTSAGEHRDLEWKARAAKGHGVLSGGEAIECGLSRAGIYRRTKTGLWARMLPDIYKVGPGSSEWHQWLTALTKWSDGVASHSSAAALLSLDGFKPGPLEVTTVRRLRPPINYSIVHCVRTMPTDSIALSGVPTTSATRTLVDLASRVDEARLELALEDALRRRLTSIPRLRWSLNTVEARNRRGARILRDLVATCDRAGRVTESGFELRLFQELRRAHLPLPVRQYEVTDEGRVVARPDFAYPDARLAIEAASYRWHSGRAAWSNDQSRFNHLVALGWRVLVVTWEDLRDRPEEVVDAIRSALGRETLL